MTDATVTPIILVIIPTYNERENLPTLIPDLLALDSGLQVLVVDDNSPDGTGVVADGLAAASNGRVRVMHRSAKLGIGRAYVAGFQVALETRASLIATMDADLSHSVDDLGSLVRAATDADLVLGSRYVPGGATVGWPLFRRIISRAGGLYARIALGVPVNDLTGGFKVYRREALAALDLGGIRSDGYCFQIETTVRAMRNGSKVVEVPIIFHDRVAGKSKLSRRIVAETIVVVWRLRFELRPKSSK